MIDATKAPVVGTLRGVDPETTGKILSLKEAGCFHEESGVYGWQFPQGSTGLYAFGNGYYYVSHSDRVFYNARQKRLQTSHVHLYRFTGEAPLGFELV